MLKYDPNLNDMLEKEWNVLVSIFRPYLLHLNEFDMFSHQLGSAIMEKKFIFMCKGGVVTPHLKLDFYAEYNAAIRF
jgi:hypothetical protein